MAGPPGSARSSTRMRRQLPLVLFLISFPLECLAQTVPSGSIDGVPIPARVFEVRQESLISLFVIRHHTEPATEKDRQKLESEKIKSICGRVRGAITNAARDEQKKRRSTITGKIPMRFMSR